MSTKVEQEQMSIKLDIDGIGTGQLVDYSFKLDADASRYGKANRISQSLLLSGTLMRNQPLVLGMRIWSADAAKGDAAHIYKKVKLEITRNKIHLRTFELDDAYVISYTEKINAKASTGTFTLVLAQKTVETGGIVSL